MLIAGEAAASDLCWMESAAGRAEAKICAAFRTTRSNDGKNQSGRRDGRNGQDKRLSCTADKQPIKIHSVCHTIFVRSQSKGLFYRTWE